jgi:phosphoglycolate phosphatase-like HAD superfamily hydrolase
LTTGILEYFLALLDSPLGAPRSPDNLDEIISYLRQAGQHSHVTTEELRRQKDLHSYADSLRTHGGGLAAARQVLGNRNDHLLWAEGDLRRTNLVKRIFEEVYLGEKLFREEYGEPRLVDHGTGLIHRERVIASKPALAELRQRVAFGIATGRPRKQAAYALETAGILGLFGSLVAFEDIFAAEEKLYEESGQRANLSKPHPFTLLEAARRIRTEHLRCAYIGDTPDDVRAANAAKAEMDFVSIACLAPAKDTEAMRREFERVNADVTVKHPDDLLNWVEKKT